MKKSLAFLFALVSVAAIVVAQYATGNNALIDWLGSAVGWIRATALQVKTTGEDALDSSTVDPLDLALPIIAKFEGFVGHAYQDVAGIWTIGYGHRITTGDGFQTNTSQLISEPDAWDLLRSDAQYAYDCVTRNVMAQLTPQQIASLISFTYNVGCGAFGNSTLLKDVNSGNVGELDAENGTGTGAIGEFLKWIHAGGKVIPDLEDRRTQEATLFASGTEGA